MAFNFPDSPTLNDTSTLGGITYLWNGSSWSAQNSTVAFADLTGKPTTLAGYGITDSFDGAFSSLTGTPTTLAGYGINDAQATLVSGNNIKTINGSSILGSGDLTVTGGGGIALTDLSVTVNAAGSANLVYDNTTGAFSYTPPDLSSYITGYTVVASDLNSISIDALSDVDTSSIAPTDGQALVWDNANSVWEPATVTITETDTLATVTARGATTNDAVTINNTLTVTSINGGSGGLGFANLTSGSDIILNATGDINASSSNIINVTDPNNAQDAATKNYVDNAVAITFNIVNSGSTSYSFTGDGFYQTTTNPTLTLYKGFTYHFVVNAVGHPFSINTTNTTGTGSQYSNGVTNNATQSGTITFNVPMDAPATLHYNCTVHSAMNGVINIA